MVRFPNIGQRADDYAFLWLTNKGAAEITANSIASLRRTGEIRRERLIVGALDEEAAEIASRFVADFEVLQLDQIDEWRRLALDVGKEYTPFGSRPFNRVALARYVAIRHVLREHKRPVVYADGDIVYLRNPAAYLSGLQPTFGSLVLAQNDRRADIHSDEWGRQYRAGRRPGSSRICSGFTVWLPVASHRNLARTVIRRMLSKTQMPSDQDTFNSLGDRKLGSVKLLRQDLFPNGSLCFKDRNLHRRRIDAPDFDWSESFIVHANWMEGMETKIEALKKACLWFL